MHQGCNLMRLTLHALSLSLLLASSQAISQADNPGPDTSVALQDSMSGSITVADSSDFVLGGERFKRSEEAYADLAHPTMVRTLCAESVLWLTTNCDTCLQDSLHYGWRLGGFRRIGQAGARTYFYAVYRSTFAEKHPEPGSFDILDFRIFESTSDTNLVTPILDVWGPDDATPIIGDPCFIDTKYGRVLHIFMSSGNGEFDCGSYFRRLDGQWRELCVPLWSAAFLPYVPKSYWFCRGGDVDLTTMHATFRVFTPNDGCCCPSGGTIVGDLEIDGRDIILRRASYFPMQNPSQW